MSKFLKYCVIVIAGVAVIDLASRCLFQYIFNHPRKDSRIEAIYKFMFHNDSDVVAILGASRADRHYASQQIEDSLNVKVFNYGFEGCSIVHQYLSLMKAIQNGGLKLALLDLSSAQLGDEWVNDRLSRYYPYYWQNDTIKSVINDIEGRDMRPLMMSSLIQYNSQLFNIFIKDKQYKGYSPLPYTGKPVNVSSAEKDIKRANINELEKNVNPFARKYLREIKRECDINGIKLIVCISPSLFQSDGDLELLCEKYGLDCWNMCSSVNNPLLFSNETHLNEKGAEEFTGILINRIKREMSFF